MIHIVDKLTINSAILLHHSSKCKQENEEEQYQIDNPLKKFQEQRLEKSVAYRKPSPNEPLTKSLHSSRLRIGAHNNSCSTRNVL